MKDAEHAEADEQRRDVRHQHGRARAASRRRPAARRCALCSDDPDREDRHARGDQRRASARRAPAPVVGPRDARSAAATRPTPRTTAPRTSTRPGVRTGDSGMNSCDRDGGRRRHDRAEPEDPVVGGVVDEQAAERPGRAPPPMPSVAEISPMLARDALARELVADDPEAEREDAAADALQDAAGDDDRRATCRAPRRPSRRRRRRATITSSRRLPNMSPSRPKTRREDRGGEQVAGERPGDAAGVGVQSARCSSPSAGMSVVWASAKASAAMLRMSRLRMGLGRA